jgi:hypothetical protein
MLPGEDGALFAPGPLRSLWEMLEKYAYLFSASVGGLTGLQYLLHQMSQEDPAKLPTPEILQIGLSRCSLLRQALILSDMTDKLGALGRLEVTLSSPGAPYFRTSNLSEQLRHFLLGLRDSLEQEFYFHVAQADVPLFAQEPFGPLVTKKFPKATEDISEAAKCLALQRSTACVLHLMRVLELAVQAFGKKLRVQINVEHETWYQILEHVGKAIKALPSKKPNEKARKAALAAASATLDHVRIAWRNESMHPKQTYAPNEALDIFNASRAFMTSLANAF